jgi:P27 family predicted phage terminase small subunit
MAQHSIVTLKPRFRPTGKLASPPRHLAEEEAGLFRRLVSEFAIDDSNSVSLLSVAMEAHQRMREARELLAEEGAVIKNRFGARIAHPAVAIERDARTDYLRSMKVLNLKPDPAAR